jgi:hypothetical protein
LERFIHHDWPTTLVGLSSAEINQRLASDYRQICDQLRADLDAMMANDK